MSALDEVQVTAFQVPPATERTNSGTWDYPRTKCIFCYEGFDMDDVRHIGDLESLGRGIYRFPIYLNIGREHKVIYPMFDTKTAAVRGQREFWRAYTQTGEFEFATAESESANEQPEGTAVT